MLEDDDLEWSATDVETAWLAGLIEGEGMVGRYCRIDKKGWKHTSTMLVIEMNDKDVLERAWNIAKVGNLLPKKARKGLVETYVWRVTNKKHVKLVCNAVLPHMGQRRTLRMIEVLSHD